MKTQGGRLLHAAANAAAWKALALLSAHAAQAGPALGVSLCIESGTLLVVPRCVTAEGFARLAYPAAAFDSMLWLRIGMACTAGVPAGAVPGLL